MLEEMGHVNHIFCDKTGTLTKNILLFRAFAVDGYKFTIKDETPESMNVLRDQVDNHQQIDDKFLDFWRCLCICHDVI